MNMTTLDKARALLDAMRHLPGPLEAVEYTSTHPESPEAVTAWRIRSVPMDCTIADDLDEAAALALVDLHEFAADVAMAYQALVERLGELTAIAGMTERPTRARRQRRATQPTPVNPGAGGGGEGTAIAWRESAPMSPPTPGQAGTAQPPDGCYVISGSAKVAAPGLRKLAAAGVELPAVSTDTPPPQSTSTPFVVPPGIDPRPSIDTVAQALAGPALAEAAELARPPAPAPMLDTPVPGRTDPFEIAGRKLAAVAGVLASVREGLAAILAEATEVDAAGKMVIPPSRVGQFVILQQVRDQLAAALEVHPHPDAREPVLTLTASPAQSTA